ncbi:hypothetical protein Ocin01_18942 [Orchesella cincta]|uniref:Uncharacterized protein n=1 Tax=Orchesella cincta TaxID=48709 RepID=A0A1D2M439_ORCCI|nr:hypothetical protein Ocin01_18942 [Orchesella cincta]
MSIHRVYTDSRLQTKCTLHIRLISHHPAMVSVSPNHVIREALTDPEILSCFQVIKELRPHVPPQRKSSTASNSNNQKTTST